MEPIKNRYEFVILRMRATCRVSTRKPATVW